MLDIEKKAKNYLRSMDRMIMGCDTDEEVRMLACAMMTSAVTILEQQMGPRGTKKLLEGTLETRYGKHNGDRSK
jgi:hypothetical protein